MAKGGPESEQLLHFSPRIVLGGCLLTAGRCLSDCREAIKASFSEDANSMCSAPEDQWFLPAVGAHAGPERQTAGFLHPFTC